MTNITCLDDIKNSLQDRGFVILYFSSNSCNVCINIFPKVKEMLKTYPDINLIKVDVEKIPSVTGEFSVFTLPCVIMFLEGKELIRQARFISLEELERNIKKLREYYY